MKWDNAFRAGLVIFFILLITFELGVALGMRIEHNNPSWFVAGHAHATPCLIDAK